MPQVGDTAPSFSLPGVTARAGATYDLQRTLDRGYAVVLLFYPFDFSPVCTSELCALRDAEFVRLTDGVSVWAVSADSVYAHWAFTDEYGFEFPLLSDSDGTVAERYGVRYEEWEGHRSVPKRAAFVVDTDQRVRYRWVTDDATEPPAFEPIFGAIAELDDVAAADLDRDDVRVPDDAPYPPGHLDTGETPGNRDE